MSLEEVAEQTDVAKATQSHYFSGKDELVAAVLAALTVDVNQRLEEELKKARDRSYLEQIRALIRKQIRILTDTAPEVATVLSWPKTWPESFVGIIKDSRRHHDSIFRRVVEAGLAAGRVPLPGSRRRSAAPAQRAQSVLVVDPPLAPPGEEGAVAGGRRRYRLPHVQHRGAGI
jgi:TetR/AcrR family transcriptional regulator, regulator of autoinduction and epiphytic fitness